MATFTTLATREEDQQCTIELKHNALNTQLLTELNQALDAAEANSRCRFVILKGNGAGTFCIGMDLKEYLVLSEDPLKMHRWASRYMNTLKRLSRSSKVIIAAIDGKAIAGGVGLAAACDFVVATEAASFKLSEAMWGLIPAMVTPFLLRRIGFQSGFKLSLTAQTIAAKEALELGLVDILNDDLNNGIMLLRQQFKRIDIKSIKEIKCYFGKWLMTEEQEASAIEETVSRMLNPEVKTKIRNFVEKEQLPWK